ncbi:MAG: penicillin-binding protein 1C [Chitinophagaceae bacterium]
MKKGLFKWFKKCCYAFFISILLFFLLNLLFPLKDKIDYSTVVTDDKGEVIHAYLTPGEKWRMKTELSEISPLLRKAIIEKEDKWFNYHPGINAIAIARALIYNVFTGRRTSGASTITMQVARLLEPKPRTVFNKVKEMFRALQLEWKYSKDEILQMYINLVPYGGNVEGVKSASVLYLKKNPDHLSLAEITALSIIPNRPNSLQIGINNDAIVQQRNKWLQRFGDEKVFGPNEIADALHEPLNLIRNAAPQLVPHLSYKLRRAGETNIHSYLHMNTQLKTEELVKDYVQSMAFKNIHNASVIVIDNETHQVITYIGSADFKNTYDGGQVNGAAAIRQPGSTLKPLLYGLCIDAGLMTPKSIITDVAINYQGYVPENYDKKFNGLVSMEFALDHSLNIPAVKSLKLLGKDQLVQSLASCGFQQIAKDQGKLGLSMILGGCGCTLEELTGLFSAFANEGEYISPLYNSTDSGHQKHERILSKAAAFMITEILSKINRPDFPVSWSSTIHLPKLAWKTGTSYGRRDAWSIGYNKKYTVGVWLGNFSGVGVPDLSGANVATPLLFKIFNTIDYDGDREWYTAPATCEQRTVCSETGMVPGEHCTNIITDYFIPLVSPTEQCNNQKEVLLSADEKWSYSKECAPAVGYKKKVFKIIPPEIQQYYEDNGIKYEKIPPLHPDCANAVSGGGPRITAPVNGSEYFISKEHPEPLALTCQAAGDVNKVYWYINNQFFKSGDPKAKLFFMPQEGPNKISCTDDQGRNRDIWVKVKLVAL